MNERIEDIKPVRWNRRKIMVVGVAGALTAVVAGFFMPKYGLVNKRDKESAVETAVERYTHTVDSLEAVSDSLEVESAKKDSALRETINNYNRQLGNVSDEHRKEKDRLAKEYETREAAARAKLEMAEGASLESFLVQYPGFDKDRDYISSIGYWGSRPKKDAVDFEDYVVLRRSLEFMLEGRPEELVRNVLEGRAVLMSGEVAKRQTKDISVRDGVKYFFVADENGNPKGYGMDFDQYEAEIGGK